METQLLLLQPGFRVIAVSFSMDALTSFTVVRHAKMVFEPHNDSCAEVCYLWNASHHSSDITSRD